LKERIKDLQKKNRELSSNIQSLEYQGNMDGFKVNYQWGKFKHYTEKLDALISEMKSKIGDEAEENEYEIFMKERTKENTE
jgi:ATP-dependent Zn protease